MEWAADRTVVVIKMIDLWKGASLSKWFCGLNKDHERSYQIFLFCGVELFIVFEI